MRILWSLVTSGHAVRGFTARVQETKKVKNQWFIALSFVNVKHVRFFTKRHIIYKSVYEFVH